MLPTRKEILLYIGVGIKCLFLGAVVLAAGASILAAVGFFLYAVGKATSGVYVAVGPLSIAIPFIVLGVLYGLFLLGRAGDRKDWFRDELGKRVAQQRRDRLETEKRIREHDAKVKRRVGA